MPSIIAFISRSLAEPAFICSLVVVTGFRIKRSPRMIRAICMIKSTKSHRIIINISKISFIHQIWILLIKSLIVFWLQQKPNKSGL